MSDIPHSAAAINSDDHHSIVVAQTVEQPPDPAQSKDTKLDLKDPDVKDIGWNSLPHRFPAPFIHGLSNDDLFTLIRRFDKQLYHVKAIPEPPKGQLDLESAQDEEFSPDKLRSNLERLYMTVIVGLASFAKHIARLRSWNESRRTAAFCIAYFLAWYSNTLGALFSITLLALILHPPSRSYLFPPAPLAAVSASTGNLQKPPAGTLASKDSLSGAPETHSGEAVEQEASNFVTGFASVAVGTATGQGSAPTQRDDDEDGENAVDSSVPDPTHIVQRTTDAKDVSSGGRTDGAHDATKKPVETAIWEKARPFMRIVADTADGWERVANVLSPTPPFSHGPRLKLAMLVVPVLLASLAIPTALFVKGIAFAAGFGFFGQPLITHGAHRLTQRIPNWRELLELRRTLLRGVPTNAQLTLTLLRLAEAHRMPLPPPPSSNGKTPPPDDDAPPTGDALKQHLEEQHSFDFDTSAYAVDGADTAHEHARAAEAEPEPEGADDPQPKKTGGKLARLFKRTAKATVDGALGVDHLKAKVGSEPAKRRLGAVPGPAEDAQHGARAGVGEGPTAFAARLGGKQGQVLLVTGAASPCVAFVLDRDLKRSVRAAVLPRDASKAPDAVFAVGLADIRGLRKVGGYGWRGKLVIGWALQREVLDGLEIEGGDGEVRVLTAIKGRDELFNRLVAVGGHKWECW
ncbi:hypothetical protein B0H21DRAFT_804474 [Amylocystis lapponica]|nr:hypothetical protein B0H21DRAFT_804474 [Amylocystis lapponica]